MHPPGIVLQTMRDSRSHSSSGQFGEEKDTGGEGLRQEMSSDVSLPSFEAALEALSSIMTPRTRAERPETHLRKMFELLKVLKLEEPLMQLKVIHVAGTKGKGSTCTFVESIMRSCGFRTGLYTSPHLINICERFRLNGMEISEEEFTKHFWTCWNQLKDNHLEGIHFFQFLTLLALKIFIDEKVDVAILEVGLGGKYDATNVVNPTVCGITSLGYDHMEILGNTLKEIAEEKAGIMKVGVPAFTVPQPEEAMEVLKNRSNQFGIPLQLVSPLEPSVLGDRKLGLDGDHQYINAGLAVGLCDTWLRRTGYSKATELSQNQSLPEPFVKGLAMAKIAGRTQIISDPHVKGNGSGIEESPSVVYDRLLFYLDGAHSPESMEACANWFSNVIKGYNTEHSSGKHQIGSKWANVLMFNCMSVRDPQSLLCQLVNICSQKGDTAAGTTGSDLSWQLNLQKIWESLVCVTGGVDKSASSKNFSKPSSYEPFLDIHPGNSANALDFSSSAVLPSVPMAVRLLRKCAQRNPSLQMRVLVTGSLHLVGDVLKMLKK
eukprot:TRINITY_DN26355_c0_g1_i2.p1 TRINITY_DN26355_c0_g1~~TRINITY_DN26355_c0_g1_i2.p1  ORF type:complete len:547 (+),score=109.68 TRINITY_DN26355_c0_g1_i2:160-1800(+)